LLVLLLVTPPEGGTVQEYAAIMSSKPRILLLYAHPGHRHSRGNRRLLEAARAVDNVQVHDLYESYPDFHIDVAHEQRLLEESSLIVFQFPVQWYSMPALLKEWVDTVLEHGWAYGRGGDALRSKDFWLVATTGGTQSSYAPDGYHHRPFSDFLPPIEQTVLFCGMRWLPPLILHGARRVDDDMLEQHAASYARMLASYPGWAEQLPAAPYPPEAADRQHCRES